MTRCAQKMSDSRLYILGEDGNRELVGAVTDAMIEVATAAEEVAQACSEALSTMSELSFTFECKASKQMILATTGIRDIVLQNCPNKRVSHLAIHAKKKRTRTKNLNRAFRIAEKGNNGQN